MAEKYRLLGGTHYQRNAAGDVIRCNAGDVLELSEAELAAFGDKFELVKGGSTPKVSKKATPAKSLPAVSRLSAKKVLAQVKAGTFNAQGALDAELARKKPRSGLVKKLLELIG